MPVTRTPYYTWIWVGSKRDPARRVRMLALVDSGSSLTVLSKSAAERLQRCVDAEAWHVPDARPTARAAWGRVQKSEGQVEIISTA